ncbi:MAG: AAA family ATPase [Thermoplasmata archaeon]|jgi:thymidylate kinase
MPRRGRLIALEGGSAAGKTTLVREAARELGWYPLAEAVDRMDPSPSLDVGSPRELLRLEATLLAEEVRRYREARYEVARGVTVLADTGFLGPVTYTRGLVDVGRASLSTYRSVERIARPLFERRALGIPDLTVYLATTPRERARRARVDRLHHPRPEFARHEAVGAIERTYFESLFPSALPERFLRLRGRGSVPALVRDVRALGEKTPPVPPARADGLLLLALLRPGSRPRPGAPRTVAEPLGPNR